MSTNLRSSIKGALNSSIKGGLLAPKGHGGFRGSTLDLDFAGAKSLKNQIGKKDLVTFRRTSSATFVDGNGLIKTTPVNFALNSNLAQGSPVGTPIVNSTPNVASPRGITEPVRQLGRDVSAGGTQLWRVGVTSGATPNTTYTISFYAKTVSGGTTSIDIDINDTAPTSGVETIITGEWTRITKTGGSTNHSYRFFDMNMRSDTADFYVWGVQIEEGSTASDYIPTGSAQSGAPRFNYDPATGESLGLLIEEERTNLVTHSDLSSAVTAVSVTNTASTEVNPQGAASCRRLLSNAGSGDGHRLKNIGGTTTSANNIIVSAFVKKDTHRYVYIGWGGTTNSFTALFDIEPSFAGDRLLGQGGIGTHTNIDAGYENYANGWVRIFASGTTSASDGFTLGLSPNASTYIINNWSASGTEAVFVHGAQYEDNATFLTSYIPTSGATKTRTPDIAEITGADFAKTNLLQYSERLDEWDSFGGDTLVTPNVIAAPDGTITADLVTTKAHSTLGGDLVYQIITTQANADYVASVYVKSAGSAAVARFFINDNLAANRQLVDVNLTNEWQRVFLPVYNSSNTTTYIHLKAGDNDGSVKSFYAWGVQLEEGSVLTEYTPSIETFVRRASPATYVDDATGFIRTTPVNLFLNSETFDNAYWGKDDVTVTANAATAPDGSLTAEEVTPNQTSNKHRVKRTLTLSTDVVASFHVKSNGTNFVVLKSNVGDLATEFDIVNGVVTRSAPNGGLLNPQIVPAGDGWYRISGGNSSSANWLLSLSDGTTFINQFGDLSYLPGAGEGIYLWGAQLEEGTTVSPYIETTSTISGAARYENGELILEEERTNLLTRSEAFENWSKNRVTVSSNTVISPAGDQTADTVIENTENNTHLVKRTVGVESGKTYTASVFVKPAGRSRLKFGFTSANFPFPTRGLFNLDAGTAFQSYNTITNFGNGWYRLTVTNTANGTGSAQINIDLANDNGATIYTGDGTSGLHVWGAQVEEGAYVSSYIANDTNSSGVIRAADVSTSALGVDSWYNQTEGAVFIDGSGEGSRLVGLNDGTDSNRHELFNAPTNISVFQKNNGVNEVNMFRVKDSTKASFAYALNDYGLSVGGSSVVTDTSATPPTVDQMSIGNWYNNTGQLNGHIKRLSYFPTRLPDATLQSITS